jgi:head-tail adaptor
MGAIAYSMNRRITIEYKVVTQNSDYGTESITWTTLFSRVGANIQEVLPSRSESLKQGLRLDSNQIRVRLRRLSGITSDMRVIVHDASDKTYQIIGGPSELDGRRVIELVCEKYTTTGQP